MSGFRAAFAVISKTLPDMTLADAERLADAFAPLIGCQHAADLRFEAVPFPDRAATCVCGHRLSTVEVIDRIPAVADALRAGRKIQGIKELRERTRWGLGDSKFAVDAWNARAER